MTNPSGPYPGRQLFLGMTLQMAPFFAYLITGRSAESRERKAIILGDKIRIGPLGNQQYDPLRHYSAVIYDNVSMEAAVSNGIQTEAIFEIYKLILNTVSSPHESYMEKVLEGAGAEPDAYHTPRIAGIITPAADKGAKPVFIIGIKAYNRPAKAVQIEPQEGTMVGISTYSGSLENPQASDPSAPLAGGEFKGASADELAKHIFDISSASYKGNDIRVCTVGGIYINNRGWALSILNIH
jgi:IMP cyclohydrolase